MIVAVAYDVSSTRVRTRIAHLLEDYGVRVQRSVFECVVTSAGYERFCERLRGLGFKHYSARTILHVLRHHSALQENGTPWKVNDHASPYLARLFDLRYPAHAGLFEKRETKAVTRAREAA